MGDRVKTILGEGTVVEFRVVDQVYVIRLGSGKTGNDFWSTLYTTDKLERLLEQNAGGMCVVT